MEKLQVPLENEALRYQLDWIVDRANEDSSNLNFPSVSHVSRIKVSSGCRI
jgi:hypothetical protein